jgi:pilus assembly protein Flp/PilA
MKTAKFFQSRRGQNTAEYLIMLVLVAVGSIGIFTVFGTTVRKQLYNAVAAFTGKEGLAADSLDSLTTVAKERADRGLSMAPVGNDEFKAVQNGGGN